MPASASTVGVEEEFLLVDEHGRLAASGPEITESVDDADGQVEQELQRCQVESATEVCVDVGDLVAGLRDLRDHLAAEAARLGQRLLPSATSPLADDRPPRFTPDGRYQRMSGEFGELARAALTCACHVHVGIPDRESGLLISNHIRPWLPSLLALAANSPFHDGVDTRYASWRYEMCRRWPSAGPPPRFDSTDDYESGVEGLMRSGAIMDRGMIYWDVRLSEHEPTVEIRIADVLPTVEHAALVAVLVRALAGRAMDGSAAIGMSQEVLRGQLWRAARDGLSGRCVDPRSGDLVPTWELIDGLVDELRPYLLAAGDIDHVTATLARLRGEGGGAQRQRAVLAERGSLTAVIDSLAWHAARP
ncbi:MAG TPA: glutamate--cysteine ligase [Pseudonocardiaceae bacterium]|nr:glutamate--cysteine ligase [Pseudonocardiaceae bacterium]